MNNLNISDRLKKVANCVRKDSIVADIGCDHAYTAIYLIKKNIAKKVIAMDINEGPLKKAKTNISKNNLEEYIDTRLSDGGKQLKKNEVDTVLISGMGGRLVNKILEDSIQVIKDCEQLVLQPQSEIYLVRQYIKNIGFYIDYEDMFIDDGKYYVIISALKEYDVIEKDSVSDINKELFDVYGEFLLKHRNDTLHKFLLDKYEKTKCILNNLLSNEDNAKNNIERISELRRDLQLIREGLKYYEM